MRCAAKIALALCVVIGALTSRVGFADSPKADAWESPPPANLDDCASIDGSLIVPVPMAHRSEAIARLKEVALVDLTQPDVAALLDQPPGTDASGADQIRSAVKRLEEQRREELENGRGSWSLYDQQRLDGLSKMLDDPTTSDLRPFLTRAVAKNEATGAFAAEICGESLVIGHGSLGRSIPPSIPAPVIVFLQRKPMAIYLDWSMAE